MLNSGRIWSVTFGVGPSKTTATWLMLRFYRLITTQSARHKHSTQQQRALRVAIIGCPNAGKSALTNALIRANVCAVSNKIDTTRGNTVASLTENMCQLLVEDSPGLIGPGHARRTVRVHTDDPIMTGPSMAIEHAEQIVVVQDVTRPGEYLKHSILYLLHRYAHIPACLVLNKVDLIGDRSELLSLAHVLTEGMVGGEPIKTKTISLGKLGAIIGKNREDQQQQQQEMQPLGLHPVHSINQKRERDAEWHRIYNQLLQRPTHKSSWKLTRKLFGDQLGWPRFTDLFFASALTGEGVDALRAHLRSRAQTVAEWRYKPEAVSTKDPRMICAEHVRSAMLDHCPSGIGYSLRSRVSEWEMDQDRVLRIAVDILCPKERAVRFVSACVQQVEQQQRDKLQQLFHMPLELRLFVVGPDGKRRAPILQPEVARKGSSDEVDNNNALKTTRKRRKRKMMDGRRGEGSTEVGDVLLPTAAATIAICTDNNDSNDVGGIDTSSDCSSSF